MSTVYSAGYTKYNASKFVPKNLWGARLAAFYDSYEAVALAAGSTIYMFMPPKGAKYAGLGQLAWDDLSDAGASTLEVGISSDTDFFLPATSVVAAADKADLDAGALAITALGYEFDGATPVLITNAGAVALTGTIKLMMAFLMPT